MADKSTISDCVVAVQFTDKDGDLITQTNMGLTLRRIGAANHAFYGTKGHSLLTDAEFADLHAKLDLTVPDADDDDLTTDV